MTLNKEETCIIAPAKLNLNLHVISKDIDGYHFLKSHVCFLNLYDYIYISKSKKTSINQDKLNSSFNLNDETILLKTLKLFKEKYNWSQNFNIRFIKNIPIGAGLGGGSADAAALLLGLRLIFNKKTNLYKKVQIRDILKLGFLIGSDVPSCVYSKSLRISHKGENLFICKTPQQFKFLLIYPNIRLSTKKVFETFDKNKNSKLLLHNSIQDIEIYNSLLEPACVNEPKIKEIINTLKSLKNIAAYGMTGSGSTCFGIFANSIDLKSALTKLNKETNNDYFIWHGNKKEFGYNRILY